MWHNGEWIDKSFFPKSWTRTRVLQEVIHIIKKTPALQEDKGYLVALGEHAGVEVKVVLTCEHTLVTAYPNIRRDIQ